MQQFAVITSGKSGTESLYFHSATNDARVGLESPLPYSEFCTSPHRNKRIATRAALASNRAPPGNTKSRRSVIHTRVRTLEWIVMQTVFLFVLKGVVQGTMVECGTNMLIV